MTTSHLPTSTNGSESCKTMGVEVTKDKDGWSAETRIELGGQRLLRLRTAKHRDGGVATRGSVSTIEGDALVTVLGQDYTRIFKHDRTARCSEKTVKEFHSYFLAMLPSIQREISQFYNPLPWVIVTKPGQADESICGEYRYENDARACLPNTPGADLMKRSDSGLLTTEF